MALNFKKPKRLDGKKILVHLTQKLEVNLRSYRRKKGIESEQELIRQAVCNYIYADYKDETLKLQGLKQLQEKVMELRDMIEIIFSYMHLMHKNILAYHPEIDQSLKEAALSSSALCIDKFFAAFHDGFRNNPPFFERLLDKYFTEDKKEENLNGKI
jgi:hypothetical protein